MLKLIENLSAETAKQLSAVFPQDVHAAFTLFALLDVHRVAGAWVQTDCDEVTALVVSVEQVKTYVYATEQADFEELQYFMRSMGASVICAAPDTLEKIGVSGFAKKSFMALHTLYPSKQQAVTVTDKLRPIYDVLIQSAAAAAHENPSFRKYSDLAYKEWLSKTSRGIFGGYTVVKAVYAGQNSLLSVAVADVLRDTVYIRDVATDREYRQMGYGSDCVRSLCADLKTDTNTIFLLCEDLQTEKFYEKSGFRRVGYLQQGIVE